jgi:hypothetical protein
MVSTPICINFPGFFLDPFNGYFNSDIGPRPFWGGKGGGVRPSDKMQWYLKNESIFFLVCYSVILIFSIVYTEWASVVETLWVCIQEILGSDLGHIILAEALLVFLSPARQ